MSSAAEALQRALVAVLVTLPGQSGRWRITERAFEAMGLLRGRRGSEWAMQRHAVGDRFVLIDADTLLPWTLPPSAIGREIRVSASGTGDASPVEVSLLFQARAMRPPAPVALSAALKADGSFDVGWTRRSRLGWDWLDDTDVPLAEETERYQLTATRSGGRAIALAITAPSATAASAEIASIGGSGPLTIGIAQIGTTAASLPAASIVLSLGA
jgi:hypothetical protein